MQLDSSKTNPPPFPFYTARQIASTTPAKIEWVAYPWVARGSITEVDGKIKKAGKTTWITAMCRCVLDGSPFMGKPTTASPIVYLTEQTPRSFRETLRRADLLERDDFHVVYWHDTVGTEWPDIVRYGFEKAAQVGAGCLVVDTFGQFAGLKGDDENKSGAVEAIKPMQECVALYGIGGVLLRHDRKSGGEVGDSARGSTALGGAVDIIVDIRRPYGKYANCASTVRHIASLSRFDETPDETYINWTDSGYVDLGAEPDFAPKTTNAKWLILECLPDNDQFALTLDALCDRLHLSRTLVQGALKDLAESHDVTELGVGKRGSPFRYRKAEKLSA